MRSAACTGDPVAKNSDVTVGQKLWRFLKGVPEADFEEPQLWLRSSEFIVFTVGKRSTGVDKKMSWNAARNYCVEKTKQLKKLKAPVRVDAGSHICVRSRLPVHMRVRDYLTNTENHLFINEAA